MDRKFRNKLIYLLLVICVVVIGSIYNYYFPKNSKSSNVKLIECIDGDTARLNIDGKDEKVRFLGIDAPEIEHENTPADPYGNESKDYTCKTLKSAKSIHLEFEESRKDKYDRILAWVFVDDKLLNEDLVEKGLAKVAYLYDKYKYTAKLKTAEKKAKNNKLNIWKIR